MEGLSDRIMTLSAYTPSEAGGSALHGRGSEARRRVYIAMPHATRARGTHACACKKRFAWARVASSCTCRVTRACAHATCASGNVRTRVHRHAACYSRTQGLIGGRGGFGWGGGAGVCVCEVAGGIGDRPGDSLGRKQGPWTQGLIPGGRRGSGVQHNSRHAPSAAVMRIEFRYVLRSYDSV